MAAAVDRRLRRPAGARESCTRIGLGRPIEELARKVLQHTSDERPYTTAVNVDRFEEDDEMGMITIFATVYVERDSQKPIVIGKQGTMIKRIGTEARQELQLILGTKVFLDLRVAVHQGWREDERFLGELEWPLG